MAFELSETQLITALSGGLAGAFLTQLTSAVLAWWREPQLKIIFSPEERGCIVDTAATHYGASSRMNFLRIHIANTGKSTAHSVCVSSVEISYTAATPESQTNLIQEEVLDLRLAVSHRATFDLPRGLHRFVDIFYLNEPQGSGISFGWGFIQTPKRIEAYHFGAGDYSMKVIATAENAFAITKRINWKWDGTRAGLKIIK
jgi:hypothetical protein